MTSASTHSCHALIIASPASNQGKTTVTAALARLHRNLGRKVTVFKAGPDFLDPMIHHVASGNPVYNLDLWMVGEESCKQMLYQSAQDSDLIIIECGMGLYDGKPSSADLARTFGVPVVAVIDASSMAQTFGALAYGLANYQDNLPFAGVIANRVGSENHKNLLAESIPPGMTFFGAVPRSEDIVIPDRHLGLVQADEITDLDSRLDQAAKLLMEAGVTQLPAPVEFHLASTEKVEPLLSGVTIAIAKDQAFGFVYQSNLECLEAMGAELTFFSPLNNEQVPQADALWLPGGYPELYAEVLADNQASKSSVVAFAKAGNPVLAECGGMLYLLETLVDKQGNKFDMCGLLPGVSTLCQRFQGLGMQSVELNGRELRGHTFHHTKTDTPMEPAYYAQKQRGKVQGEAVYKRENVWASYLHLYFPSNPELTAMMFKGE